MTTIKLRSLKLHNFKGLRDFTLESDGQDTWVYGDNATGKTTLVDAFNWLLFDKDSKGQSQFPLKTTTPDGQVIHQLDHEVQGVLVVDGEELVLRKVYAEKWTKRRGAARESFTGHTTDYFIDGVPQKKKDYDALIADLIDPELFRLLTDPRYFSGELHWTDRRRILLEVCGDVDSEDIIAANGDLAALEDILGKRSIDEHKKVIAAKRREINKQLDKLPVRIDEVNRSLPDISMLNRKSLQAQLADLQEKRSALEEERVRIESGGEIATKKARIQELEMQMRDIERELKAGIEAEIDDLRERLRAHQDGEDGWRRELHKHQAAAEDARDQAQKHKKRAGSLRDTWHMVNAETFEHEVEDTCPACGQDLPANQVEEAHQKALEEFNADRAQRLADISAEGKAAMEKAKELEKQAQQHDEKANELQLWLAGAGEKAAEMKEQLEALKSSVPDPLNSDDYQALLKEKQQLSDSIATLRQDKQSELSRIRGEIQEIDHTTGVIKEGLAQFKQVEKGRARIAELKAEEEQLAAEYERLEHELYLIEEYTRTRVDLLEERINSRFDMACFQLFEEQVNGGLNEVCETLHNGVPWSGINNAAQVNVGIDIINTLSEHYGFSAPIWIDNAESVTQLMESPSQVIRLVVSEGVDELTVNQRALAKEAV